MQGEQCQVSSSEPLPSLTRVLLGTSEPFVPIHYRLESHGNCYNLVEFSYINL
jgi:hypothetical protein